MLFGKKRIGLWALTVSCMAMVTCATPYHKNGYADRVEFQTFEMDGEIKDMMWCGNDYEVILVQTNDGSIYRSSDRGGAWKKL